ncbi:NAD(P)-dependent oxidoreductase [Ilyobacter sp.]|uniref:NAD(P)-dependent oxidoreductase n=1 Tax=Ilyobacter sp. TaxID=3100343 RepID=UPI00356927A5
MKVGFIGLGVMGKSMAINILNSGHKLKVYDVIEESMIELKEKGAEIGDSTADTCEGCDVIMTSLPNSKIVEEVILGKNGVLEGAEKGSIIVDLSSITPKVIQNIYEKCADKGIEVIDAPVSGGAKGAEEGTLTIMVGGKAEVLEKVKPILECIGKKINYVGQIGAGDTVKLINNLLLGVNMVACAEALALGTKAGIKPDVLYEIISQSSGSSYALKAKYENFISQGNFEPGFMIDLQYKDLELAISTAKDLNAPMFMGNIAQQIFETARAEGLGKKDISAVINLYEKWLNISVRK